MIHHGFLIEDNTLINVFKEYYVDNIQQYNIALADDLNLIVTNEISFRLYANKNKINTSQFDDNFNPKLNLPDERFD